MDLIESEQEKQPASMSEPEPRYQAAEPARSEDGQTWLHALWLIIVAVILVVLLVLLARWIYHKTHENKSPAAPTTSQSPAQPDGSSEASGQNSSGSSTSLSGSSGAGSSSNSPAANGAVQTPNTGPGSVALVFAGSALAAAGLHYLISVRRFAGNS